LLDFEFVFDIDFFHLQVLPEKIVKIGLNIHGSRFLKAVNKEKVTYYSAVILSSSS